MEEVGKVSFTAAFLLSDLQTHHGAAVKSSTKEQIQKFVVPAINGKMMMGLAGNEAQGGNALDEYQTFAKKDGDNWIINGSKVFITEADTADVLLVIARTKDKVDLTKMDGIEVFYVKTDTPGVSTGHIEKKIGWHSSRTGTVYLKNVVVSDKNRIPDTITFLMNLGTEAGSIGATALGGMEYVVDETIEFLKNRIQHDESLWNTNQSSRTTVGKALIAISNFRNSVYGHYANRMNGINDSIEAGSLKYSGGRLLEKIARDMMLLHGGSGSIYETGIERFLRDALQSEFAIFSNASFLDTVIESYAPAETEKPDATTGASKHKSADGIRKVNTKVLSGTEEEIAKKLLKEISSYKNDPVLNQSEVVLIAGRGVINSWNKLNELSKQLNIPFAYSRGLEDTGITKGLNNLIGISGNTISPKLVITMGVSGAFHFITGIKNAGEVISVDINEHAPIFKNANYKVVSDANKIIDEMLENVK
ncbi:acyl-CoA dehydrogenase family protein [Lactobacillus sp. HT06-2]|uniref:acyl-CoA dehydrogenase family protein n=1 Tax=Lactobacillus sp. HT06-2 TaxID=2080222 RepID=UPI000CD8A47F|nr:acyl-CoA dehydrogenase family protein [Lactobacillus sp. HT06-2]